MPDQTSAAFISYSREDSEFALRLAKDLKAAGARVWLDQLELKPGLPWDNAIEDALLDAQQMLVILSPTSVKSENVRDEISYALRQGKVVIPVLYMDCTIPLRLERKQHIDCRTDYAGGLAKLLAELRVESPNQAVLDKAAENDAQREAARRARAGGIAPQGSAQNKGDYELKKKEIVLTPLMRATVWSLETLAGYERPALFPFAVLLFSIFVPVQALGAAGAGLLFFGSHRPRWQVAFAVAAFAIAASMLHVSSFADGGLLQGSVSTAEVCLLGSIFLKKATVRRLAWFAVAIPSNYLALYELFNRYRPDLFDVVLFFACLLWTSVFVTIFFGVPVLAARRINKMRQANYGPRSHP